MYRKKRNNLNSYYNIIVLILLLGILFSLAGLIFNLIPTENPPVEESRQEVVVEESNERLYRRVLSWVIPEGNWLTTGIFNIDLDHPQRLIQSQITAFSIYDDALMASIDEELEFQNDPYREIYLVDKDEEDDYVAAGSEGAIEPGDSDVDRDDLGERHQGIVIIGDDNIVDSLNNTDQVDLGNIDKPRGINFDEDGPDILIYHTHGTETYHPASEGNYHSLQEEYSVMATGAIVKEELEKRGYNVIHDRTHHSYPSYSGSYTRSLATAREILEENPSIKVVIDLHRDGFDHIDTNPNRQSIIDNNTVTIDGEVSSRFQLVIGSETPNIAEVERMAKFVTAVGDLKYPGFSKPVLLKPYGRFNQFLSDHYILLELGSNANTIEEGKRAAKHFADVLADSLDLLKQ